jgi:hypothetical protein
MKKLIVIACAVTSLVGCVSQEQLARERAETAQAQNDLDSARTNATVSCNNKQSCEKAFSLAKIYVQENADMKIQLSDDTMVSTYNPTQYGYVALRATKIPGAGDSSTIQLVASCNGMDVFFNECARRIAPIYRSFKPYIESKL